MDPFLSEQLKRIHELTERLSSLDRRTAELNEEIRRDREVMHQTPLHEVRDYRTHSSQWKSEPVRRPAAERADRSVSPRRRRR